MTRRPRTTARTRKTEQLVSGYCEICRISYRDLSKHVQSDQHLSFVQNDDNFLSLDTLINAGANVEAFLKLNRTKDIEYVKYIVFTDIAHYLQTLNNKCTFFFSFFFRQKRLQFVFQWRS